MIYIILIFSVLTFIAGIAIIIEPNAIFDFIGRHSESLGAHIFAVVVRVIIGVALISCSAVSKFPITLQFIAWVSLVSAVITALIGRTKFKALIAWAVSVSSIYKRIGGFVAILFGSFLFYAVA